MCFQLVMHRPPKCRSDICEDVSGDVTFQQHSRDVRQDVLQSVLKHLCKYNVSYMVLLLMHLNPPMASSLIVLLFFALHENSFYFPEFKSQKLARRGSFENMDLTYFPIKICFKFRNTFLQKVGKLSLNLSYVLL